MSDLAPTTGEKLLTEPIGFVEIGGINPATLTKEEYQASSELLFHGHKKPFKFRRDYKLGDDDSDGSQTLGEGFYTTDDREAGLNYAHVRSQGASQNVTSFLPYNAQMLDLRSAEDPINSNGYFPNDLANKWLEFYTERPANGQQSTEDRRIQVMNMRYLEYLKNTLEKRVQIDLRILLETAPAPELNSRNYTAPPWITPFREFMLANGIDGVIYNEGGEGQNKRPHASFIFYNYDKIGSFEDWNSE
jgi:hypothetical protein